MFQVVLYPLRSGTGMKRKEHKMKTWNHKVSGKGTHALAANQTCTCSARHIRMEPAKNVEITEKGKVIS